MALYTVIGDSSLAGIRHRRWNMLSLSPEPNPNEKVRCALFFVCPSYRRRWLGTSAESTHPEFSGSENAYEVLGVPETSSFEEIKASFRKLAKETHPDLVTSSDSDPGDSKRFVDILAAYEILSDPTKRAHYDQYLLATRHIVENNCRQDSSYHMYATYVTNTKKMEVVEWLRWYRYAVKDILSERSLPAGSGYFDVLQKEFYSAIHSAYFGPEIQSLDLLPDCFEAEERSVCETPEVLHLVSGRDLFGIVRIADGVPELSDVSFKKLTSAYDDSDVYQPSNNLGYQKDFAYRGSAQMPEKKPESITCHASDAYKSLELHVCGRLVAMATRTPPKESSAENDGEYSEDQIHVFFSSNEEPMNAIHWFSKKSTHHGAVPRSLLGTINGLGTLPDESSCYVYNSSGTQTHVILKHRTPLVKHMHWFQLADEISICECRCTRARLPPSKYWLFEPRCSMHDIGGWYIETYGRDKKSKIVPSQRYWDDNNAYQQFEKRLHPAVYLLALAYRTLDMENAGRPKRTIWEVAQGNLSKMFSWCKKLV